MNGYGYIYITENLINGKKYIGQHKSESLDESYKGSGIILQRAFNKYGIENFKTEILEWCQSREELNEREKYWISYHNAVDDPMFYNIARGGEGGDTISGMSDERRSEVAQHSKEASKKKWKDAIYREKVINGQKEWWKLQDSSFRTEKMKNAWTKRDHAKQSERMTGEKNPNYGVHRSHTEETKKKISESCSGSKNGMYGKRSPRRKKVLCIELGRVFESICDAAEFIKVDSSYFSRIVKESLNLGSIEYRGYHWKYAEEVG